MVSEPLLDGDAGLDVRGLHLRYGETRALDGVSIRVAPGEIVAVVGPSGCGKSSLLRTIAGLEPPDRGTVAWDGVDLASVPPHRRGFGLMFQDHALFPHRRVAENVEFGLRMQGLVPAARRTRVDAVLRLVGLEGFDDRAVDTLSGGEAQRVALARALAPAPRLLMLDEPLGSLDRALRDRLAEQLRSVLSELGQAAIHVTHDQDEAYAVADRIVVMRAGRVVRDGVPAEVWRDPGDRFVADFLGHPNVLDAGEAARLGLGDGHHPVVVRDAAVRLDAAGIHHAQVVDVAFRGSTSRVTLHLTAGGRPIALVYHDPDPAPVGQSVRVTIDPAHVAVLRDEPQRSGDSAADRSATSDGGSGASR
jgi:thiamine transport system ATP-binding protein